jgi:hypothetical protein
MTQSTSCALISAPITARFNQEIDGAMLIECAYHPRCHTVTYQGHCAFQIRGAQASTFRSKPRPRARATYYIRYNGSSELAAANHTAVTT